MSVAEVVTDVIRSPRLAKTRRNMQPHAGVLSNHWEHHDTWHSTIAPPFVNCCSELGDW